MESILQYVSSANIENPFRWGKGLAKYGESVASIAILASIQLLPNRSISGVPYNYNHAFEGWLTNVVPLIKRFLIEPQEEGLSEKLKDEIDRYLVDCLPMTQPSDATMVKRADSWNGVGRLARARWYNKGYVPQHRVALAIRAIYKKQAIRHVGDICKSLSQLIQTKELLRQVILDELMNSDTRRE